MQLFLLACFLVVYFAMLFHHSVRAMLKQMGDRPLRNEAPWKGSLSDGEVLECFSGKVTGDDYY